MDTLKGSTSFIKIIISAINAPVKYNPQLNVIIEIKQQQLPDCKKPGFLFLQFHSKKVRRFFKILNCTLRPVFERQIK